MASAFPRRHEHGLALGTGLTFTWVPTPFVLVRDFETMGVSIRSYREPLNEAVRKVMVPSIQREFDTEGEGVGYWEPLVDSTISARMAEGYDPWPILQRTGKLAKRATQINIWTVTAQEAYVAGLPHDVFYGGIHQEGTNNIPARPFMVMLPENMNDIEEIFFDWIEKKAAIAGFI